MLQPLQPQGSLRSQDSVSYVWLFNVGDICLLLLVPLRNIKLLIERNYSSNFIETYTSYANPCLRHRDPLNF